MSESRDQEQEEELLLLHLLRPLWRLPSFPLELAWRLSRHHCFPLSLSLSSHTQTPPEQQGEGEQGEQEGEEWSWPSPAWLSALDRLDRAGVLAALPPPPHAPPHPPHAVPPLPPPPPHPHAVPPGMSSSSSGLLRFCPDALRLLTQTQTQILPSLTAAVEESWALYMMHWATETALLDALLNTADALEAVQHFRSEEHHHHYFALFDFLLEHSVTREEEELLLRPKSLIPLLYRICFTLGGHLAHVTRWLLPPSLGLALCRCVSQTLDPFLPLSAYHPALHNMSESVVERIDGFSAICGWSRESGFPPHVNVPSHAYLGARLDLAKQLRVHSQFTECREILNNIVVLSTSIPDYTDMPCTLTQRALLELALAQQDMTGKHSNCIDSHNIEHSLEKELNLSSSNVYSEVFDGPTSDADITAILGHVLEFCESYPRGKRQRAEILHMQSAAFFGLMTQHAKHGDEVLCSDNVAPSDSEPARRGRSSSTASRNIDMQVKNYLHGLLESGKKSKIAALRFPFTDDDCASVGNSMLEHHPETGEIYLRTGEQCKAIGDLIGAKDALERGSVVFANLCCLEGDALPTPPDSGTAGSLPSEAFSVILVRMATIKRPNVCLAQTLSALGLVLDELDEREGAHECYSLSKQFYRSLFGDYCLAAADLSVNRAMLFWSSKRMKKAQKELTEALQIYMFRLGHTHTDTREVKRMLDSVTEIISVGHQRSSLRIPNSPPRSGKSEHIPGNKEKSPPRSRKDRRTGSDGCYFKEHAKYKTHHTALVDQYHEALSECRCLVLSVNQEQLSITDATLLKFDTVLCRQSIDAIIVESFLRRLGAEKYSHFKHEVDLEHIKVQSCLKEALARARNWECREIRLRELQKCERVGDVTVSSGSSLAVEQLVDVTETVALDIEKGQFDKPLPCADVETSTWDYVATPVSLLIATLLTLEADHSMEVFISKLESVGEAGDNQSLLILAQAISNNYHEAISIYKACLGDTNLTVANVSVTYASHMLSFLEYTSSQLAYIYNTQSSTSPPAKVGSVFNYVADLFPSRSAPVVLPLRINSNFQTPPSATPDPDTIDRLTTLNSRCQEEAETLLDESLIVFQLFHKTGNEARMVTCNAYDGQSSQFEIKLGPTSRSQESMSFTHFCAQPERSSKPLCSYRGEYEARVLLVHVHLHQDRPEEALEQCGLHLQHVKSQYAALARSTDEVTEYVLSPPSPATLDSLQSTIRMQELDLVLSTDDEVAKRPNVINECSLFHAVSPHSSPHTYVADAYVLQANVLQADSQHDAAVESLLASLHIHRRIFGDRDAQFIWLERPVDSSGLIEGVPVKYDGDAFVTEGGSCGTTIELAKMYNTLGAFYHEQGNTSLAIDMCMRSLTVLRELSPIPGINECEVIGPKVGLLLCNLGDMLVQTERMGEAEQMYILARKIYSRLGTSFADNKPPIPRDLWYSEVSAVCRGTPLLDLTTHAGFVSPRAACHAKHSNTAPHSQGHHFLDKRSESLQPPNMSGVTAAEENAFVHDIRYIDHMLEALHSSYSDGVNMNAEYDDDYEGGCILM